MLHPHSIVWVGPIDSQIGFQQFLIFLKRRKRIRRKNVVITTAGAFSGADVARSGSWARAGCSWQRTVAVARGGENAPLSSHDFHMPFTQLSLYHLSPAGDLFQGATKRSAIHQLL